MVAGAAGVAPLHDPRLSHLPTAEGAAISRLAARLGRRKKVPVLPSQHRLPATSRGPRPDLSRLGMRAVGDRLNRRPRTTVLTDVARLVDTRIHARGTDRPHDLVGTRFALVEHHRHQVERAHTAIFATPATRRRVVSTVMVVQSLASPTALGVWLSSSRASLVWRRDTASGSAPALLSIPLGCRGRVHPVWRLCATPMEARALRSTPSGVLPAARVFEGPRLGRGPRWLGDLTKRVRTNQLPGSPESG